MPRKEADEKISEFWKRNKIFEKSIESKPADKVYIFYDGPPFATGTPHYGHLLGLTSKDLFPRFWTMKGYRVERRWGWDCHGLPIENIVEKSLSIKNKKKIEEMGVQNFNQACRSKVLYFAHEWKKTVEKLGKWIEFDNAYKTMDTEYMESVWYIFKRLYDEKLVYEDKKILMYCPRCQTPLAKAETAMDNSYKEVTERTAVAKFKLKGDSETYLLAWTTTPWTLIGNVALAVNPNMKYVKLQVGKEKLILAKARLSEVNAEHSVISEFDGRDLLGKEYYPLYDLAKKDEKAYVVIDGGEGVSSEEGTGIVHLALYGEFDYDMIKRYGLALVQHIGSDGELKRGPKEWLGMWFKDVDKLVIDDLSKRSLLFKADNYSHSYPFCYRCETPLFYHAVDSWFINIQKIKDKALKRNEDINWYPAHLKEGAFKHNIETAPDWTISRNRFWATAMPVWKCTSCNEMKIIGSINELKENAVEKITDNVDLHKDYMDGIHVKCGKCKGVMNRIPEVFDCWLESASMPYASKHYPFEHNTDFDRIFPADFVSEYIGQIRTWFYYMHVIGVLLFDSPPFKNVVVTGIVLAEDGAKMSKSKHNFPDPDIILDKYGADALRFYFMESPLMLARDLNFSEKNLKVTYQKIVDRLSNVENFYRIFAAGRAKSANGTSKNILDMWITNRLNSFIKNSTEYLDKYDTDAYCGEIAKIIEDLSVWYVRESRDRFRSDDENVKDAAVLTLRKALLVISKVSAPLMPFVSEEVYQMLKNDEKNLCESVHLDSWPSEQKAEIDEKLETDMAYVRDIVSRGREFRDSNKLPVRQPLKKVVVRGREIDEKYTELIKAALNVKGVEIVPSDKMEVSIDKEITKELLMEGIAREFIRNINDYRKELKMTISEKVVMDVNTSSHDLMAGIKMFEGTIKKSTQTEEIVFSTNKTGKDVEIGEYKAVVSLKKT